MIDFIKMMAESKEAKAKGICFHCKEEAAPKIHSELGRREYNISGLCEECFDELFADCSDG